MKLINDANDDVTHADENLYISESGAKQTGISDMS